MDTLSIRNTKRKPAMFSLILAGEAAFILPFHLIRYFKSSMMATFGVDEYQIGQLGAVYGFVAMISYIVGGPLADRFSARKLMCFSLIATALGGLYMASFPNYQGLFTLFAIWGATTILTFWAPLIVSTRKWGGAYHQGQAFGILDSGRGLVAALVASAAAHIFSFLIVTHSTNLQTAIRSLVLGYTSYCLGAAVLVWLFVPESEPVGKRSDRLATVTKNLVAVLKLPVVWLHALIIIAAYSSFKMLDNYGLYTEDLYNLSAAESAKLVAYVSLLRVGTPVLVGWIADKFIGISLSVRICFTLLILCYTSFFFLPAGANLVWAMVATLTLCCAAFFALRGIYFALFEETGIRQDLTGTAVGVVCIFGFTPEIFVPPLSGWFIREARAAGDVAVGYNQVFGLLIILTAMGFIAAWSLGRYASHEAVPNRINPGNAR